MAAMMVPTAVPFFFAYGRDTRRPAAVVITLLIYVAVWAAVGAIADFAMGQVMMPSSVIVTAAAVGFAGAWTLSPWSGRARALCYEMCMRAPALPASAAHCLTARPTRPAASCAARG